MLKKFKIIVFVAVFSIIAGSVAPARVTAVTVNESANSYLNFTVEQLQTLIAKLQARLEELKKKSSPCFVSDMLLSIGDGEGSEAQWVKRLQDFLRERGVFKVKSTGYFGKITRAAVYAFQKENGLEQTGEFDEATKTKAHSFVCMTLAKVKQEVKKEEKKEEKKEVKKEEKKEEKKETEQKQSGKVSSISIAVNGSYVTWTTAGYSKDGFKVVWSKNAAPTYPTREDDSYIYLDDPSAGSATLDAFDGHGVYHVRVCEYLGGVCGVYSNELTTSL